MDPLSVIASTIAVIGTTISASEVVLHLIRGLKALSAELIATCNDVTDFKFILTELEDNTRAEQVLLRALQEDGANNYLSIAGTLTSTAPEAPRRLEVAKEKLLELEALVKKVKTMGTVKRAIYLEKSNLRILRDKLRDMKISISAHFSIKNR
jgi:hypothetical protein